jgi:hypothetical protein
MTRTNIILFLLFLLSEMCLAQHKRGCDINAIWLREGDNLVTLFGMDWQKVYLGQEFPVLIRKGRVIKSPDLVPAGVLIQIPSNTWLSEEALARLSYYRSLCSAANLLIDSAYSMMKSASETEGNKHQIRDARVFLVAAESTITNWSFDFNNCIVARGQAEQAMNLLKRVRQQKEFRFPYLAFAAALILSLGVFVLYQHRRRRESGPHWQSALETTKSKSIVIKELFVECDGRKIRLPLQPGVDYVLRVGGPDAHITSPKLPVEVFCLEINDHVVFLRNSGEERITVGEDTIDSGELEELLLHRPVEIHVSGCKLRISKREKVIRPKFLGSMNLNDVKRLNESKGGA